MYTYNLNNLINVVPDSIKLELLKKELLKVYKEESEIINIPEEKQEFHWLNCHTRNVIELIQKANLSDENLTKLYKFAKEARHQLGLEDNLFNVHECVLYEDYTEINEEINKRNNL